MLLHTWLPATLRGAGIKVVETAGWTGRSHGALPDKIKVVWHHDASAAGDSPGALNWMISNWNTSSAQVWIDNYGTWHLVGTGQAWHAGSVKAGMPGNKDSIGIETDHTTGEKWPAAQLNSLRAGTAAIFKKQGVGTDWLHFHKSICDPPGRKVDPDGLDLGPERTAVSKAMGGTPPSSTPPAATTPPKPPPAKEWDEMASKAEIQAVVREELQWALHRALNVMMEGKANAAFPAGSTIALDNMGLWGRMDRAVNAGRTGNPNAAFPNPGKPKD